MATPATVTPIVWRILPADIALFFEGMAKRSFICTTKRLHTIVSATFVIHYQDSHNIYIVFSGEYFKWTKHHTIGTLNKHIRSQT